jgi:hypothetical protein
LGEFFILQIPAPCQVRQAASLAIGAETLHKSRKLAKAGRGSESVNSIFCLEVNSIFCDGCRDDEDEGKDEHEQNVEMKDLPPVVQKTIQDSGGAVTNIEKESEDSKTHYSADVKKDDGNKMEIKVAEDGNLIKVSPDDVKEEENEDED